MSKVLILGASGDGKSTSIGELKALNHIGLNPKETFIISCTAKPLPFPKSAEKYRVVPEGKPPTEENGNRYISNKFDKIAKAINFVATNRPEIKNIVIDDLNYALQDYYMLNSLKKGYDVFKELGKGVFDIFDAMENYPNIDFFCLAHYEEYRNSNSDSMSFRFKSVGKMVTDYLTPEGKFEIVLFMNQTYDDSEKKVNKVFVTNFDGNFPAKSPIGMFEDLYIPNDLGYVKQKIKEYYN